MKIKVSATTDQAERLMKTLLSTTQKARMLGGNEAARNILMTFGLNIAPRDWAVVMDQLVQCDMAQRLPNGEDGEARYFIL